MAWAGVVFAVLTALAVPRAHAVEAADCWRRFFEDAGISRPVGEIVTFRFAGRTFRIPRIYLQRGVPRLELGADDAVRLFAWPPNLAPLTPEQGSIFWRPASSGVRITIFGHPHFLRGQELIDRMIAFNRSENRDDEPDAFGFRVFRSPSQNAVDWGEIHVSPDDPNRMFHCDVDGRVPNPGCTARRWIGGPLRLEMNFRKRLMSDYTAMEAALTRIMTCALDPAEAAEQVWPQPGDGR
jgi:hypothetical protein